ncbi:MAG: hypothetical protein EKK39_08540 [Sphingobacteriales bacterium]|nr:MAG: hypothetical protein EKK39_08540 [Sphingobacteriales bacterium]
MRSKTSIDKNRFQQDPAFVTQRQYSEWLQIASPIASKIYRQLPRQKGLQQKMTGQVMRWLKQGYSVYAATELLMQAYLSPQWEEPANASTATTLAQLVTLLSAPWQQKIPPGIFAHPTAIPLRI